MIDFDTFVGKTVDLYGVDGNCFKIGIEGNTLVFEALEDEDDGYRSCMGSVEIKNPEGLIFFDKPVARGTVRENESSIADLEGYSIVDEDDHEWLVFGTNYMDSYYPCFVFAWQAKDPNG
jgi:hypothetical protein